MDKRAPRITDRTASLGVRRRQATHCRTPYCGAPTTHGKPYCLGHVDQHRYVREILDQLHARRDELARVERSGRRQVDVLGIVAQDILTHVDQRKAAGINRLGRELGLDAQLRRAYERALVEAGLLERQVVGRRQRLQVLPAGRELLSSLTRRADELHDPSASSRARPASSSRRPRPEDHVEHASRSTRAPLEADPRSC